MAVAVTATSGGGAGPTGGNSREQRNGAGLGGFRIRWKQELPEEIARVNRVFGYEIRMGLPARSWFHWGTLPSAEWRRLHVNGRSVADALRGYHRARCEVAAEQRV